ncbi:MAG: M6 family metalloprotease domain-containing protein [Prevotella sp.]|jgi:immune inhibitor A|uniref:M6 family metalloprotease domain-containing protein n=1 Tax=Segatella hominis TaxID=2518605 RepID=UPI003F7E53D0|nr:M6 family metalloprotease domain-containing protein [Prevotella sp.]
MKKILLSIVFALMGIASGFAAKAHTGLTTITQSDGSQLTIRLHGDEHFSWYSTADDVLIVQVGSNYYVAQVEEDGTLKATPQLAHNAGERGTVEEQVINNQNKEKFLNLLNAEPQALAKTIGTVTPAYFPHTGSPKALVILVEFQDVKFKTSDPVATFTHYLKGAEGKAAPEANNAYVTKGMVNYGSVSQYFNDMSQGKFTPQFDIVGPVTVSKNSAYYGGNVGNSTDVNFAQMIAEACKGVSTKVNFADYDQNNDGYVDLVYVIYAGYSESINGNSSDCLWPKSGINKFYEPGTSNLLKLNGKKICRYGINNELNATPSDWIDGKPLLNGIGLFCHEFSHTMGLPDLYPTVVTSRVDNQNPEYWDLMDGGEYTYNGYFPTPYSPWEMDVMGWTAPIELGDEAKQVSLNSYASDRTAYKINGENDEYLLIQNIQTEGWWRGITKAFKTGMLVWRIDYPYTTVSLDNRLNNEKGKPNVMIVPADGYVISAYNKQRTEEEYNLSLKGDPFPGTTNKTELLSVELNNSTLKKPFYNIKETNGVITFDYLNDYATGIDSPVIQQNQEKDTRIFTLDGRYLGTDVSQLTKGVYIIGKKKVIIK